MEPRATVPDEVERVAQALADAFAADPVFSWLLPRADRTERVRRFFALELAHVILPAGVAWTTDDLPGAALALPPGKWRMPMFQQMRHGPGFARVFGRRLPVALGLLTKMESKHLRDPHWYFPYIGIEPTQQGQGLGRRLMTPTLERCDREGLPAYLEATSPDNARLYRRLGFEDVETLTFAGSPPLALMRRNPA